MPAVFILYLDVLTIQQKQFHLFSTHQPLLMRILYTMLLATFAFTVKAQAPGTIAPEDAAFNSNYNTAAAPVISGRLLNTTAEDLKNLPISFTLVTPFAGSQQKKVVSVKPDGSFTIQLDYALPYQQIWFGVGDIFWAGLYANKGLDIELDIKKIKASKEVSYTGDGVRYLGKDGPVNEYLNNYVLYKRDDQLRLRRELQMLPRANGLAPVTDSLLNAYNTLYDSLKQIQDSYSRANPSPYSWILENERTSEYYGGLFIKYLNKVMPGSLWQKANAHKSYLVTNNSADFYRYMSMYINARPGMWQPTTWKDVAELQSLTAQEKLLIDSLKQSETKEGQQPYTADNIKKWVKQLGPRIHAIAIARSLAKNIKATDSLFAPAKADFIKLGLSDSHDITEQGQALKQVMSSMHTSWCLAVAKNEYNNTVAKINEINKVLSQSASGTMHTAFGKPMIETAFGASMYKAPAIKATDFLARLKQSFPGKAIIIDRWATWCAPCLGEMPHSKTLQEEAQGLPVVFVYLCTLNGSSEDKWKSKVAEIKQPGVHFLINEDLDADISNYFSFSGYPGHAFIDKTGTYKPGAITWMSDIENRDALARLVNN